MVCSTCKKEKPEEDFAWRNKEKGMRHQSCRACKKIHQDRWYIKHRQEHIQRTANRRHVWQKTNRKFILEYLKNHPCSMCGETDPAVLEFHHLDPKLKRHLVARMIGSYTPQNVIDEVAKCQVLCANCHRRKTAKEQGWHKSVISSE